ncbi:hypothetical protein Cni_G13712 [Canna indica]|uniref:Uncharacterized protein n=1 Tax=Canna indica TaxID=4628 RepID=A0AAQ3KAD9_9LILI|nr:hypothetical protein Cni_G13712 [Canna indica]
MITPKRCIFPCSKSGMAGVSMVDSYILKANRNLELGTEDLVRKRGKRSAGEKEKKRVREADQVSEILQPSIRTKEDDVSDGGCNYYQQEEEDSQFGWWVWS